MKQEKLRKNSLERFFGHPEALTFVIMILVLVILLAVSEDFRDVGFIVKAGSRNVEFGIAALAMSFVIISGMIDLSVAATMALCSTLAGWSFHYWGFPFGLSIVFALVIGAICGLLNGIMIAKGKIQPMIVTIGTMSLYRGIAQTLIGDHSLGSFPKWFNGVDKMYAFTIGDVKVSWTWILFIVMAIVMLLILKYTSIGRKVYALGHMEKAALYSGVNVDRFKIGLMTTSGVFAAIAGILTMSRLLIVRYDMAYGGELDIITIVLIGGISIDGGKGSILGTIMGWLTIIFIKSGMTVAGLEADRQTFILGALLLFTIVLPQIVGMVKERNATKKAMEEIKATLGTENKE